MERALNELNIEGIKTNKGQQLWILAHRKFRGGSVGTGFYAEIEKEVERVN